MGAKKQNRKKFSVTWEISLIPLMFAVVGLILSTWQFIYQKNYNEQGRSSWVGIRIDQYWEPKVKIKRGPENYDRHIYRKKIKLTFSNNGYTRASIVNWDFYVPMEIQENGTSKTMRILIPGIEPKLLTLNNTDISLPLNIDAGESKAVVLEYSVGISDKAYLALPNNTKKDQAVDWRVIDSSLRSTYGDSNPTEYLVEFLKGDGEKIAVRFSNYGLEGLMQGEKRPGMAEYVR